MSSTRTAPGRIRVIATIDMKLLERLEGVRAAERRTRSKMIEILLEQAITMNEIKHSLLGQMPELEKITVEAVQQTMQEMGIPAWRAGNLTQHKREEVIKAFKERVKER